MPSYMLLLPHLYHLANTYLVFISQLQGQFLLEASQTHASYAISGNYAYIICSIYLVIVLIVKFTLINRLKVH